VVGDELQAALGSTPKSSIKIDFDKIWAEKMGVLNNYLTEPLNGVASK